MFAVETLPGSEQDLFIKKLMKTQIFNLNILGTKEQESQATLTITRKGRFMKQRMLTVHDNSQAIALVLEERIPQRLSAFNLKVYGTFPFVRTNHRCGRPLIQLLIGEGKGIFPDTVLIEITCNGEDFLLRLPQSTPGNGIHLGLDQITGLGDMWINPSLCV